VKIANAKNNKAQGCLAVRHEQKFRSTKPEIRNNCE
jgi:hypothetical protein